MKFMLNQVSQDEKIIGGPFHTHSYHADVDCFDSDCVVVWVRDRLKLTLNDTIMGTRLWIANPVNVYDPFIVSSALGSRRPAIAFNPDLQEYFVVWQWRATPLSDWELTAKRIASDGTDCDDPPCNCPIAAEAEGEPEFDDTDPDVVYNDVSDRYLIIWERASDANLGAYAQVPCVEDGTGTAVADFLAFDPSAYDPRVVSSGDDGCFVVAALVAAGGLKIGLGRICLDGPVADPVVFSDGQLIASADVIHKQDMAIAHAADDERHLVVWPEADDNEKIRAQLYAREAADLVAVDVRPAANTVAEGASFFIEFDVANIGDTGAGPSHTRLLLSPGKDLDTVDDVEIPPELALPALAPLTGDTVRWDFAFPDVAECDTYPLWMLIDVDSASEVPESQEDNLHIVYLPLWVTDPAPADGDGDSVGDSCDCEPADPQLWSAPGEVANLEFAGDKQTLSWTPPNDPGGKSVSLVYDVLRSGDPANFDSAACVEQDGSDLTAGDAGLPGSAALFAYLVRAEQVCGNGSLGSDSGGTARSGGTCP